MCPKREDIIDCRGLTPDEWVRARQQILRRAQAARARALREFGAALLHPWQAALASAAGVAAAALAMAGKAWRAYARWCERRAAVRELHALDDRTLRDIGISRSEIEWVVSSQEASRLRAATKAVSRRQHWPRAGTCTPARPQNVAKDVTEKRAA
jgi:uncharacterized protein YjiS (DUF1127 family)